MEITLQEKCEGIVIIKEKNYTTKGYIVDAPKVQMCTNNVKTTFKLNTYCYKNEGSIRKMHNVAKP
jgi:hypothetical protein